MIHWIGLSSALVLATAACSNAELPSEIAPDAEPESLVLVSGDQQEGFAGGLLDQPFVVRVEDSTGSGVRNVAVIWEVTTGPGGVCSDPRQLPCQAGSDTLFTDASGYSRVWFEPVNLGSDTVTARVNALAGSPGRFVSEATGVVITASPTFDCTGASDPVQFFGPALSRPVALPVGTPVALEYARSLYPSCTARVVATSAPPGATLFDTGILHPGERYQFVPQLPGKWTFVEDFSGGKGELTVTTLWDDIRIVSGDNQEALAGTPLEQPFVIRVVDVLGRGVPDVSVEWSALASGAICFDTPDQCHFGAWRLRTDADGHSRVWYHPLSLGSQTVVARLDELTLASFAIEVTGVLIRFGSAFDCTGGDDPVRFFGPGQPDHITVPPDTPVFFEYARYLPPACSARVVSTVTPVGGLPFDSGVLHPGDRFEFRPAVTGTWEFVEQFSGGTGKLTAN